MKMLILADIDDLHWNHGEGDADLVLSCGDVFDQVILEAASAHSCAFILAVKGNHDADVPFTKPIIDLHLSVYEWKGIRFGGINGSWRYKSRGPFLYDQEEVQKCLATFPPVDVFLSHNSPRHIHDKEDAVHTGFEGLTAYIQRTKPRIVIHGHQHIDRETQLDDTRVIGVYEQRLIEI